MSKKLETKMAGVLTQLLVLEGFAASDNFYFELGQELKETLTETLSKKQVFVAEQMAKRQLKELNE
jgi:hypothetical protein